jgi:hypothetical protein
MQNEFEEFWNRNTKILLKFCELYKTDKAGFKKYIYDQWEKYGVVKIIEPKLEKVYKEAKFMVYVHGDKKIKVEKITFHHDKNDKLADN